MIDPKIVFSSSIIPTIGRPTLTRAVISILNQSFPGEHEIIVVNDSGRDLAREDWYADPRVRIVNFNQGNYITGRNHGASWAKGRFLHFMDDDDWLLPNAFQLHWETAHAHPEAHLLYGGARLVDDEGHEIAQLNLNKSGNCFVELLAGSWIQVGQSLINTEAFLEIGGFDPSLSITEETHFQRLLALRADFAHTPSAVINVLRGEGWETTVDYNGAVAANRWSRSQCIKQPQAFARLKDSASSSYWHGRILQAYLADAKWLLRLNDRTGAWKRFSTGLLSLAQAGRYAFSKSYWQALRDHHVPCSQARLLS